MWILFLLLFAVSADAQDAIVEAFQVKKLDARTVEVREVQPDIVKTYQMIEVNQDIQTLNNEIEAEAKRCESTILSLESKRDKLMSVYDANPPPAPEPVVEPVVEPKTVVTGGTTVDPIIYP